MLIPKKHLLLLVVGIAVCASVSYARGGRNAAGQMDNKFAISTAYSRTAANGGTEFFGLAGQYHMVPRLRVQAALHQSLSGNQTDLYIENDERFTQRADQVFRLEFSGLYKFMSAARGRLHMSSLFGLEIWRTQITSTIEDTPMGSFFNFAPIHKTTFGVHTGGMAELYLSANIALAFTARYHLTPRQSYSVTYAAMGMVSVMQHRLGWQGFDISLSFAVGF